MGLDETLKQQISSRVPELKDKLVSEFDELTHGDLEGADNCSRMQSRRARRSRRRTRR